MLKTFALLVLTAASLTAQHKKPDLLVTVAEDGLYEITWRTLSEHLDPRTLDAGQLAMFDGDEEVPLFLRGTSGGSLTPSSSIVFWGEARGPRNSRRNVYRLTYARDPRRIRTVPGERGAGTDTAVVTRVFEEDMIFDPVPTIRAELLDLPPEKRTPWQWKRLPPRRKNAKLDDASSQSFTLDLIPRPRTIGGRGVKAEIALHTHVGRNVEQTLRVAINGRELDEYTWTTRHRHVLSFTIPAELAKDVTVITLTNVSEKMFYKVPDDDVRKLRRNDIHVDSIKLTWEALLSGPSGRHPQIIYDIKKPENGQDRIFEFVNLQGTRFRAYDVARKVFVDGGRVSAKGDGPKRIAVVARNGFKRPEKVEPSRPASALRSERVGGDWVVVTLGRFSGFLKPLVELRKKQGLTPYVVTDHEVYDNFSDGEFDPSAISRFLAHAFQRWQNKPRYLLLVGDADRDVDWVSSRPTLPTNLVSTSYNGETASDAAFVAGLPAPVSVGRLPVRHEDDVIRIVDRIVKYESAPSPGDWRRRMTFVASEGRFGPIIDRIIENYAVRMLSRNIPAGFDVNMTYANLSSKYVYPPPLFNRKVISRFNEGSLFYTYIGHGFKKGFDQLQVKDARFPILTTEHVGEIDAGARNPIMTIIACSTAHFDDPHEDCIGEELLRRDGGPVAVIGSTRISHPFPNSILGKEMIGSMFGGNERLGDVLRMAKSRMVRDWKKDTVSKLASTFVSGVEVDRLMREHEHLYVLLGDPATRVAMPEGEVAIECPDSAELGGPVEVTGTTGHDGDGKVVVTIEARRDRIVYPTKRAKAARTEDTETVIDNYEAANNKVIARVEADLVGGRFTASLPLPDGFPKGDYFVKAFAVFGDRCAVGGQPIRLK